MRFRMARAVRLCLFLGAFLGTSMVSADMIPVEIPGGTLLVQPAPIPDLPDYCPEGPGGSRAEKLRFIESLGSPIAAMIHKTQHEYSWHLSRLDPADPDGQLVWPSEQKLIAWILGERVVAEELWCAAGSWMNPELMPTRRIDGAAWAWNDLVCEYPSGKRNIAVYIALPKHEAVIDSLEVSR